MLSRRPHALLLTLVALLTAALLTACGSDDDAGNEGGSERSNTGPGRGDDERDIPEGESVGTNDFSFELPEGWVETSQQAPETELAFSSTERQGDVANSVNVIKGAGTGQDLDAIEDDLLTSLGASASFEDVELLDRVEIDGVEAAAVTSVATFNGNTYAARQYFAQRGGNLYTITFQLGLDTPEDEMVETAESLLATWQWAD